MVFGVVITLSSCNNGSPSMQSQTRTLAYLPLPYAGTYYPIYNQGPGQWLSPTQSTPLNKVNTIYIAFAHAYPKENGAILNYELGQAAEPENLALLVKVAREQNPQVKILISLGWGKNDWSYIAADYANNANLFVPSVISFIRDNNLDGFDIDNEDIGVEQSSGYISQSNFDSVIFNLRKALDQAALEDNKSYYLTITPAGNNDAESGGIVNTEVDTANVNSFNLINIQTYYEEFDEDWSTVFMAELLKTGYPKNRIANGISTEKCNPGVFPEYLGYAGLFNWDMTADSICNNYTYTKQIAQLVGYNSNLLQTKVKKGN